MARTRSRKPVVAAVPAAIGAVPAAASPVIPSRRSRGGAKLVEESAAYAEAPARRTAPAVSGRLGLTQGDGLAAPEIKQLLTFFASGYEYAVSVLHVREIAEYRSLAPVPGTPRWIRGVMNLRGTVVPVIDLAAKLGMEPTTITRRTCLLIVDLTINFEPMVLAIMVDAVSRVIDLAPADLQEVPSFGPRIDTAFLLGMARLDNRLVMLLDINGVMESRDVVAAAAAMSAIDEQLLDMRPESRV